MEASKKFSLSSILILILSLVFFLIAGKFRFATADEGFYLSAARLVLEGKLPYQDFFYPQMPLLPYIYGGWMAVFGVTWDAARILAALCSALVALMVFLRLRNTRGNLAGVAGAFLFCFSTLSFAWLPVAKAYSLTLLLLFGSYFVCTQGQNLGRYRNLVAGLLIGLAVLVRLYVAGLIPVFLLYIFFTEEKDQRLKEVSRFIIGGAITALPLLYFAVTDFDTFWFNNFGYHTLRSSLSSGALAEQKLSILFALIGLESTPKFTGYQFPILIFLSLAYGLSSILKRKKTDLAFFIAIAIFGINFLPSPSWIQYFSVLTPFLVLCAIFTLSDLTEILSRTGRVGVSAAVLICLVIGAEYISSAVTDFNNYSFTGKGVQNVRKSTIKDWRVTSISEVSNLVNELTESGETVLSQWPGYLIETDAGYVSGLENQFWMRVTDKLSPEQHTKYKIISKQGLIEALQDEQIRYVVVHRDRIGRYFPDEALPKAGFTPREKVHNVYIYSRKSGPLALKRPPLVKDGLKNEVS